MTGIDSVAEASLWCSRVQGGQNKKYFIHCEEVLKGHGGSVNENHFCILFSISANPSSKTKKCNCKCRPALSLFTSSSQTLIKVKLQGELMPKKLN